MNKKNWIVRMECVITKDVYVDKCTFEEAHSNPWEHAVDEREIDMNNWEVKSVVPNE